MKRSIFLICIFITSAAIGQQADVILQNGKIFTADKAMPYVSAIAIKGDKIIGVGSTASVARFKAAATKIIELEGRTVTPGFNDAHDHTGADYPARSFVVAQDPSAPTPWETVRDSIRRICIETPPGTLIRTAINPDLFKDGRARLKVLDSIAPNHPVILAAWTGHGIIVNSKLLQMLNYNDRTAVLGGWLDKDAANKLNGVLHEYACYPVDAILTASLPNTSVMAGLKSYEAMALSLGITSHQVMATELPLAVFRHSYASTDFKMRTRIIAFPFTNEKEILLHKTAPLLGRINARAEVSGIKLILDGTPIERLAFLSSPYSDAPAVVGHLDFNQKQIIDYIKFCLQYKQQIMVHAVGDAAVKSFLSALLKIHPAAFWKNKRVRIEHGDFAVMTQDDLKTMSGMGIIVVQNPMHFALAETMHKRAGDRTKHLQAMRSLIKHSIPVALGSDGPVNPFLNIMMAAMHPSNPTESISVEEAVTAYTAGSAFAEFKDKEKGKLLPGMLADLVVLTRDIFSIPVNELPGVQAQMTMVAGKIVYESAGTKQQ